MPSPRQYVADDALVPLFKLVTGRLPVTFVARFTNWVDVVPVPPAAIGKVPAAKAEEDVEYSALLAPPKVVKPVPP